MKRTFVVLAELAGFAVLVATVFIMWPTYGIISCIAWFMVSVVCWLAVQFIRRGWRVLVNAVYRVGHRYERVTVNVTPLKAGNS
jgi:hypothetical protein